MRAMVGKAVLACCSLPVATHGVQPVVMSMTCLHTPVHFVVTMAVGVCIDSRSFRRLVERHTVMSLARAVVVASDHDYGRVYLGCDRLRKGQQHTLSACAFEKPKSCRSRWALLAVNNCETIATLATYLQSTMIARDADASSDVRERRLTTS